jgi:hypothetical protein
VDVFVIPIGRDRYELYCETAAEEPDADEPAATGVLGRLRHRFDAMLRDAEARRHATSAAVIEDRGWAARVQERIMAWVAERIAEQRLLWTLRHQTEVTAIYPSDMTFDQADTLVRRVLQRDFERHRRWLVIDSLLAIASGALVILPGPNVVFYYFAFRLVGHWLSMRGATQGLRKVAWTGRPCPALAALRDVESMQRAARDERISDIAAQLRLQHLSTFYDRVAI